LGDGSSDVCCSDLRAMSGDEDAHATLFLAT